MHDIIFEVSEMPVDESDYITAEGFSDNEFIWSISDYIKETEDREDDIKGLQNITKDTLELIQENNIYKIKLLPEGKENFFCKRLDTLKSLFNSMTLEEFCDDANSFKLRMLIEDKYSSYFYLNGAFYNLDSFIRRLTEEETYFIGGVIVYHR